MRTAYSMVHQKGAGVNPPLDKVPARAAVP